jgi:hypothetical protein
VTISDLTAIDHFTAVIQQSTAPAFVLTAVAGLISVTTGKLHRLVDRIREIEALEPGSARAAQLVPELPLLRRRARLLHDAIRLSLIGAVCTTIIIIVAFLAAFLGWRHEYGMAVLFCLALVMVALAVVNIFREVHAGDFEFDEAARPRG